MIIEFKKGFKKDVQKLDPKIKMALADRLRLFSTDTSHPQLNNHALTGEYLGYRSINITGDWRVLYYELHENAIVFAYIGTHSQLFGK